MDRSRIRRLRARLWRPLLEATIFLSRWTPWPVVQWFGRVCGRLAWFASPRDRTRALDHLEIAFPDLPPAARRALAKESFRQQLMNVFEYFHLAGVGPSAVERRVEVRGWEHVERARSSGRPVIIVTGHCGNWELLGAVFGNRKAPLAAVVRSLSEKELEPLLDRLRDAFGTQTIQRGEPGAVRALLNALRGGTALLMLIDQDIRTDGVWVPFFGRLAHTPVGAARLALKRRAQTVPAFMERLEDGRHRATFSPPLELPDDPTRATALMTRVIEEQIRRQPAQWVWWHRRWRRAPPA